ncbi:MAG: TIM barrel protein [Pseudomonadota bacterium]
MPRFAANITLMFPEVPFLKRPAAARAAGFRAVECQSPYQVERDALAEQLKENAIELVLLNAPNGGAESGEMGMAALPDKVLAFRETFALALDYAAATGCPRIHCMAGCPGDDWPRDEIERVYQENLCHAAERAAPHGITVMIEPINTRDCPGYALSTCAQARDLLTGVAADNVALQFDFYHASIMEADPLAAFADHRDAIDHLQVSGRPGRHEPDGKQEIDFAKIFAEIDRLGYHGWVGCEYNPRGDTLEGLAWARPYGIGP